MNIIKEVNNRIWKLTINRESALNALNSEVMETLSAIIDEALVYSHEIKGMIITGYGLGEKFNKVETYAGVLQNAVIILILAGVGYFVYSRTKKRKIRKKV